jgi:hypothetical protein
MGGSTSIRKKPPQSFPKMRPDGVDMSMILTTRNEPEDGIGMLFVARRVSKRVRIEIMSDDCRGN